MRSRSSSSRTKIVREDFALELPKELDIAPKWEVKLPRKLVAKIYEKTVPAGTDGYGRHTPARTVYSVVIGRADSDAAKTARHHIVTASGDYVNERAEINDLIELSLYLKRLGAQLAIKRVKVTEETETEDYGDED